MRISSELEAPRTSLNTRARGGVRWHTSPWIKGFAGSSVSGCGNAPGGATSRAQAGGPRSFLSPRPPVACFSGPVPRVAGRCELVRRAGVIPIGMIRS